MKVLFLLGLVLAGYFLVIGQAADAALTQVEDLRATYSYVANNVDHIATER
jgi:hypothetical protein